VVFHECSTDSATYSSRNMQFTSLIVIVIGRRWWWFIINTFGSNNIACIARLEYELLQPNRLTPRACILNRQTERIAYHWAYPICKPALIIKDGRLMHQPVLQRLEQIAPGRHWLDLETRCIDSIKSLTERITRSDCRTSPRAPVERGYYSTVNDWWPIYTHMNQPPPRAYYM